MSVRLSKNSILNLPMLSADTDINFTFRNPGSKMINGDKMRAVSLGIQFKISKLKNDPNTTPDITIKDQFKKVEEVIQDQYASLSGQVTREQAERYGLDVDKLQFNDKGLATKYKDGTDVSYMDANPDEYLTILSDLIYNEKII